MLPPEPPRRSPSIGCIGAALAIIGVLIVIPSGLCVAIGGILMITDALEGVTSLFWNPGGLLLVLPFGAVGLLLVWLGARLRNRD